MNINALMQQAQKMQQQMQKKQKEIESKEYEFTSNGGAIKIKMLEHCFNIFFFYR